MEHQIIDYLKQVYSPKVIILAGSHATETNTDQSDWDLFLFCESEHSGGFFEWSGQLLDITIHNWPQSDDWVLTIPYGPLWPVKVLYDETNGVFDAILKRTKEKYDQGPLIAYPIGCAERLQKLDRWQGKIERYVDNPAVQFYYAGYIYEFLVRIWFEQQNLWPLPPALAFPYIKEKDPEFAQLVKDFTEVKGEKLVEVTEEIISKIKTLR